MIADFYQLFVMAVFEIICSTARQWIEMDNSRNIENFLRVFTIKRFDWLFMGQKLKLSNKNKPQFYINCGLFFIHYWQGCK